MVNGYAASESPITASAPQGSVIGPLIWNVCFSDILHLIPETHANALGCILSFTCEKHERITTVEHVIDVLSLIASWGQRWQFTLAADKTLVMLISTKHIH